MNAPNTPDTLKNNQEKILELGRGFQLSQCLFTATALGIPDLLKDGAKTCAELAQATASHAPSLYRLLRVLATTGLVTEVAPQQFAATAMAECLQEDAPDSLKAFILLRAEQDYGCWQNLPYSIKTGNSAFEQTFGASRYRYNQQTPQRSERFDRAMSTLARKQQEAILAGYDFSTADTLVDVGGGQGSLAIALLQRYPGLKAILFEQADTIQRAQALLAEEQLTSRCQTIAGSFFETLPEGKDLYILKHVLHNWDDEQAVQILHNCRRAMATGAKLLIIEGVIAQQTAQRSALLDLQLLVSFASGKLRTESEFRQLLDRTGFTVKRIVATPSDLGIIEAQAV